MRSPRNYSVIVIGAGNAGLTAVETFKEADPGFSILLVDTEKVYPYKRTKISKRISSGYGLEDFAVKNPNWYTQMGVELLMGFRAVDLNPQKRMITLEGPEGREDFIYEDLILAPGARPVTLFPTIPEKWSVVRNLTDGLALRKVAQKVQRIAVAGVGVLGVEVTDQLVSMGKDVLLIGEDKNLLGNVLDEVCSASLQAVLGKNVFLLQLGTKLLNAEKKGKQIILKTSNGESINADHVVLCLGIQPEIELAEKAGIDCGHGIRVDKFLRSSEPHIYAAGDAAEHPGGKLTGLWHAAEHQGRLAARAILGRPEKNEFPPFRLKCEVFGGYWFASGEVKTPEGPDLGPFDTWEMANILWRPRFRNGRLAALTGAAPQGMPKALAKTAQKAVLESWDSQSTRKALCSSPYF